MSDAVRSSEPEIASLFLNRPATRQVGKRRRQLAAKLTLLAGLVLVCATIFVSAQAMLICSAAEKANFCRQQNMQAGSPAQR